jgi:hypothetical protein
MMKKEFEEYKEYKEYKNLLCGRDRRCSFNLSFVICHS